MADPVASLAANPEWTRYAFMFPVGVLVATCAQTAGIGGAAIMGPFFLLGFPLLGPAYPLHSVAASVATAILCEAFGFSSGERHEKCNNLQYWFGSVWFSLPPEIYWCTRSEKTDLFQTGVMLQLVPPPNGCETPRLHPWVHGSHANAAVLRGRIAPNLRIQLMRLLYVLLMTCLLSVSRC